MFDEDYLKFLKPQRTSLYRLKTLLTEDPAYRKWYQQRMEETIDMVIKLLNPQEGLFLDFGTGTGWLAVGIEKKTKCSCIGFDIDVESIKFSNARAKHENTNTKFLVAVGERLPFKDETFDYLSAIDVLEHVVDFDTCLSEIKRVMKKDGKAILIAPNRLAFYSPGHANWKIQLKRYSLKLLGRKMDYRKNRYSGYERLFTYFGLRSSLNRMNFEYKILKPSDKNVLLKILNKSGLSLLMKPAFVVLLEKRAS